mgnify:CR=1 FL=1
MVDFNEWSQDPFALFAAFLTLVITVTFISRIIFLFDIIVPIIFHIESTSFYRSGCRFASIFLMQYPTQGDCPL